MADHSSLAQTLTFCFAIEFITPDYHHQIPLTVSDKYSIWKPPTIRNAYAPLGRTGWYYWRPGVVWPVPASDFPNIRHHSSSSLFWGNDSQSFFHVPYDCTARDVATAATIDPRLDWGRLSFHHLALPDDRCLSLVGHYLGDNTLGSSGSISWMPQLVPETYKCLGQSEYQGTCQLAGDLSILLGLIAFSTTSETVLETIQDCFRPNADSPEWVPHGRTGRKLLPVITEKATDWNRGTRTRDDHSHRFQCTARSVRCSAS